MGVEQEFEDEKIRRWRLTGPEEKGTFEDPTVLDINL